MNNGSQIAINSSKAVRHSSELLILSSDHKPSVGQNKWLANNRLAINFNRLFFGFNSLVIALYLIVINTLKKTFSHLILFLSFRRIDEMSEEESGQSCRLTALVRQREHHKKSFDIISQALKIDEQIDDKNIGSYLLSNLI